MSYYYCTAKVKWCNDYENIPLYDSLVSRNKDILGDTPSWSSLFNFDFGNVLKTKVVVNNFNPNEDNYFCLVDQEYTESSRMFYFIEKFTYLAENQYQLELELDVFVTYFQGITDKYMPQSLITRGHYPRFYKRNSDNKYVFNVAADNPICQGSPKYAMRTKKSNVISFNWDSNSTVSSWCNSNSIMWAEVYIQPNHNFRFINVQGGAVDTPLPPCNTVGELSSECSVMLFPIRPEGDAAVVFRNSSTTYQIEVSGRAFKDWLELNSELGAENFIYNIKLSPRPIIDFKVEFNVTGITSGTIDNNIPALYFTVADAGLGRDAFNVVEGMFNKLNANTGSPVAYYARYVSLQNMPGLYRGRGLITSIYKAKFGSYTSNPIDTEERFSFTAEELKGDKKRMYEPKIMQHCKTLKLRDTSGNSIEYSPLWLNTTNVTAKYTEAFGISNTNYYLRLASSGLYPSEYQSDWHGVVSAINLSLNVANNNLGAFLVQNKNYVQRMDWLADNSMYMQMINTAVSAPLSMLGAGASSLASGNPIPAMGAMLGTGGGIIGSFLDNYNNKQIARAMYNFNKQDAMNSFNTLRNTNDNLSLPIQVNDGIKFYIDKMEAFEIDQSIEYDNLFLFGYELNLLQNPYYFLAGEGRRKYFNYLQAHVEQLFISCPYEAEQIIKRVLDRGARFWHLTSAYGQDNMYQYEKENYETLIV